MRILYKDTTQEFLTLLQEAVQNKDRVECINVSRLEMQQLLAHSQSKSFFGDYWGPRDAEIRKLDVQALALSQQLEHATTQQQRQDIWNQQSDIEVAKNALLQPPTELTQSGIKIRVSMKA